MDHHLGYEKHSNGGDRSGDSRNDHNSKKVIVENREVQIGVSRDRNGTVEPVLVLLIDLDKYNGFVPLWMV